MYIQAHYCEIIAKNIGYVDAYIIWYYIYIHMCHIQCIYMTKERLEGRGRDIVRRLWRWGNLRGGGWNAILAHHNIPPSTQQPNTAHWTASLPTLHHFIIKPLSLFLTSRNFHTYIYRGKTLLFNTQTREQLPHNIASSPFLLKISCSVIHFHYSPVITPWVKPTHNRVRTAAAVTRWRPPWGAVSLHMATACTSNG